LKVSVIPRLQVLIIRGMTVFMPGGVTFTIERACSGADFLAVGLAVAALHG
jgi:hypothetical protein